MQRFVKPEVSPPATENYEQSKLASGLPDSNEAGTDIVAISG